MKSLTKYMQENMENTMRKYHLSYDNNTKIVLDRETFDPREYIIICLHELDVISIESPCESTIIFTYQDDNFDIVKLVEMVSQYFYIYVSLIALDEHDLEVEGYIFNDDLDNNIQDLWNEYDVE
ncbi:hypothetical protein [Myroides odoratimimus]|uniref:hypothetical protein n=1 Tax=Myroides odoratimimus TaxID=76832 RepID=UPI00217FE215|nr:hypothetical protein [Myroides odoratimimus]MCS7474203.1 hypothetical protein [Myroides odoratimimus]